MGTPYSQGIHTYIHVGTQAHMHARRHRGMNKNKDLKGKELYLAHFVCVREREKINKEGEKRGRGGGKGKALQD